MIALSHARAVSGGELRDFRGIAVAQRAHFFPDTYARAKLGISYPPHELVEMCLDETFLETARETNPGRTGLILSAGNQCWSHDAARYPKREAALEYGLRLPYVSMSQIYAGRLASRLGVSGHVSVDASACASGLKCLMDVAALIETYGFERVIVVAADDAVCNIQLGLFGEVGASITIAEEEAGLQPSAFDSVNRGFRLGQGAAVAVFDRVHDGLENPLAFLRGQFAASEALGNAVGQRPDGQGYADAIRGAMEAAGARPSEITAIKTHGTGTGINDISEPNGIAAAGLGGFVATALKPRIGHTMGPSGLLETILLLEEMRRGVFPEIPNRTEKDDIYLSSPVSTPDGLVLSLAAGMGNIYAAAIFEPV